MLQEAAESTLGALTGAISTTEKSTQALVESINELGSARTSAEGRLQALLARADELKGQVEAGGNEVRAAGAEAQKRLDEFSQTVSKLEAALGDAQTRTQAASESLHQGWQALQQSVQTSRESVSRLVAETNAKSLELVTAAEAEAQKTAEFFTGEFKAGLDHIDSSSREKAEALTARIVEQDTPAVQQSTQQLRTALEEALRKLQERAKSANDALEQGVNESLNQTKSEISSDVIGAAERGTAESIATARETVELIGEVGSKILDAKEALVEGMEATGCAVEEAAEALAEIRRLLERVAGQS